MIKVTIKLTLGNELGFTCASCLVFVLESRAHCSYRRLREVGVLAVRGV